MRLSDIAFEEYAEVATGDRRTVNASCFDFPNGASWIENLSVDMDADDGEDPHRWLDDLPDDLFVTAVDGRQGIDWFRVFERMHPRDRRNEIRAFVASLRFRHDVTRSQLAQMVVLDSRERRSPRQTADFVRQAIAAWKWLERNEPKVKEALSRMAADAATSRARKVLGLVPKPKAHPSVSVPTIGGRLTLCGDPQGSWTPADGGPMMDTPNRAYRPAYKPLAPRQRGCK